MLGKGCAELQSEPLLGKGSDRDSMKTVPMSEANKWPDIGVEKVERKGVNGVNGGSAVRQERKHKEEGGGTFPECRVSDTQMFKVINL